jgi:hypothetical protein
LVSFFHFLDRPFDLLLLVLLGIVAVVPANGHGTFEVYVSELSVRTFAAARRLRKPAL